MLWIIFPAASYTLWLISVVGSEWSLWFGTLGLTGAMLGLYVHARGSWRVVGITSLVFGLCAAAISLYPFLSVREVASTHNVSLSLTRYMFGWLDSPKANESDNVTIQTHTFAVRDSQSLQLDAYLPQATNAPRPAVIFVHGGSWSAGERSDFPQWNVWLARNGYAVFDIDYRLAPQPNYETATEDVREAVRWVKANAARFNVNTLRLALLGRSAGGHLALLAAYTPERGNETDLDSSVQAVIAVYPPVDLTWDYRNPANQRVIDGPATLRSFTGTTPDDAPDLYVNYSPIARVSTNTPATLLLHGGHDQLVRLENTLMLAEKLNIANVPHEKVVLPYAQHGYDYNFNGWGAQISQFVMLEFLRTHLQPPT